MGSSSERRFEPTYWWISLEVCILTTNHWTHHFIAKEGLLFDNLLLYWTRMRPRTQMRPRTRPRSHWLDHILMKPWLDVCPREKPPRLLPHSKLLANFLAANHSFCLFSSIHVAVATNVQYGRYFPSKLLLEVNLIPLQALFATWWRWVIGLLSQSVPLIIFCWWTEESFSEL
jgi:hypothetical protein